MKKVSNQTLLLIFIIIIGAFLRFYNINWDQGQHLQPDERFLTMVGNSMTLPSTISQYFDPATSTFNPSNIGHKFYVYGVFPVTLNKVLSIAFNTDTYDKFVIQGRIISGILDLMIVFLIYKSIQLFEKKYKLHQNIKYYGAFFYSIAVLPIQLSHFFAVDTFLNFFMFASFYFIAKYYFQNKLYSLILCAMLFGLALASKVTALFLLPIIFFFIFYSILKLPLQRNILRAIWVCIQFCLIAYFSLRLADPYLFQYANLFDPRMNSSFIESLRSLSHWGSVDAWYPPGVQWIHKSPIFGIFNLAIFGLGVPYFTLSIIGIIIIFLRFKRSALLPIFIWIVFFIIYHSLQVSKTMRYFLVIYPYLAIFAGIGFHTITKKWKFPYKAVFVAVILLWPLLFFSIYTKKHSRVEASEWIYNNVPNDSLILSEYWDDALPLRIDQSDLPKKQFSSYQLTVFDPDTEEKWEKMNKALGDGDYYILSSNRAWGSIPTVPERYPRMTKFYEDLFAGRLKYKKIKEFTSYPSLKYLGIPIEFPDDFSEEAFSVNDHPRVMIFQNMEK